MPILTTREVQDAARRAMGQSGQTKTAGAILREAVNFSDLRREQGTKFDVFLSHSSQDANLVLGIKQLLEDRKLTVYVDWINDPQLDRSKVTPQTAATLRSRMKSCKSLFFVDTDNSISSKWMPWECGYFDAHSNEKVAIIPVRDNAQSSYAGREFLGLYYYITFESVQGGGPGPWVRESEVSYASYQQWMQGSRFIPR